MYSLAGWKQGCHRCDKNATSIVQAAGLTRPNYKAADEP
jgi:hypothetical protein